MGHAGRSSRESQRFCLLGQGVRIHCSRQRFKTVRPGSKTTVAGAGEDLRLANKGLKSYLIWHKSLTK